jgi:purine-binding chemotaxis protein CheW
MPGMRKLLVFEVSGRLCALPVEAIREITHIPATVRVPGQPSILEGFLNLHGLPVAVVSLSRLFQLPHNEPGLYAAVIIARAVDTVVGLLVDSVEGVTAVDDADMQALPLNHSFNDCAEAQFESDGRPVTLLACDRILLDKERRCAADLVEQLRERMNDLDAGLAHER